VTETEVVVRSFLELLADDDAAAAVELLDDDLVWKNTGLPTIRGGRRVGKMLLDMEQRRINFTAVLHHVAADGNTVLTERTDVLRWGRWHTRFWVCGTFEVREGRIVLWDDHFSMGSVLVGSLKGLAGLVRR
jgi:limonene-1,2-epoxide hydrolase